MTDHIEAARKVLRAIDARPFIAPFALPDAEITEALDRAGLLVTPEMRELCETTGRLGYADDDCDPIPDGIWKRFRLALRAYRATLKPKDRWTVTRNDDCDWSALLDAGSGRGSVRFRCQGAELEARAYAAQRNREEAGAGGAAMGLVVKP